MEIRGHYFREFKSVERICRCGFVIERNATPRQVEARMRESLGYVFECSGQWHVFPKPNRKRDDGGDTAKAAVWRDTYVLRQILKDMSQ